ncbi:Chromosome I, complete genome, related [Eimeria tenella]|uniref:Chromosome I, complete genome, related n=1 Tax=Eimeria tenella TaxID=5802 RepID=U6L012_EIMTE|nr:Chromosome I, complete genome, related [Eimeria tenella]CDJ41095.1 Chromosome I, complete genome, related [Eimeria tenella]|eukprot:XP_013231845.1 Chromosome I, complete genome, related [Eimeria tenella]
MGTLVPVPPASGEAGPVALELPPKPIPLPLSGQLNPSAFITNLWLSVRVCPCGFSRSDLLLIARSLPKAEVGAGISQPVIFRMQRPACTALLSPTGTLSIMGGITKEQALWQAYRVAYKLKYRIWWKPVTQGHGGGNCEDQPIVEYVCNPEIEFSPEASSVLQLVCRVDLGGSFRPDIPTVLDHPQIRTVAIDTRDGVAVRIPHIQASTAAQCHSAGSAVGLDGFGGDMLSIDAEDVGREFRGRRAARAKGPTCLIFRTGKILVLGCKSPEEINAAIDFVWPAVVGL